MPMMIRGADGRLYRLSNDVVSTALQLSASEPHVAVGTEAGMDDHLSGNFDNIPS